jgi:replicative DNA helicase
MAESRERKVRAGQRIPPHNLDAEESLLGALLLSRDALGTALEMNLLAAEFYKPAHQHIFEAIRVLAAGGQPVDPVTVADELRRAGLLDEMGGSTALLELQAATPAISNVARYARIVQDTAMLRRLIGVASEIAELAYLEPDDVAKALDEAESKVFEVAEHRVVDSTAQINTVLREVMDDLEVIYTNGNAVTGVATGFIDLDEMLTGFQPNQLIIVGARPSMGKTALALNIATHVAKTAGHPVLFFSLEMGHKELAQRVLSAEARVDSQKLRTGKLDQADWSKIGAALGRLEVPLFIDENPNVTVMEIRAKARRLKARYNGISLVLIDYLQLMSGTGAENRQLEISEISRNLKILARELEVPVVALSQLSRNLESRTDKRPMLSDLRESGCMPAPTKLLRADTGEQISLGELVLSQKQPMVWSVDKHQRLVPAQLLRTFPSGIKECFRLSLASGRSVEASANHPFLTIEGWQRLDELSVGAFVATPRCVPEPMHASLAWTNDELALLAHLLGDGTMGPSFKYATADPANRDLVADIARRRFGIEANIKLQGNTFQMWFPSPYRLTHGVHHPMHNWLDQYGLVGSRSWNKYIPNSLFGCSSTQIRHFLHHLWATDGSLTIGRNGRGETVRIYYATTSHQLALDVQTLLLRVGIRSAIGSSAKQRSGGGGAYRLGYSVRVQGVVDQTIFLEQIGCHGARGAVTADALAISRNIESNPNNDLVPWPIAKVVKSEMARTGTSQRQLASALGEGYCGSYLLGDERRPRRFSRDRLRRMAEVVGSDSLADVATSDLYWDQVVSIESTGMQPTFDATIEGTHNFIADGVVAHNSIEQDADVVMFVYRDEVYNPDSPDRGSAEIIVGKHRNGPIGTKRLSFLGHYTRFESAARGL